MNKQSKKTFILTFSITFISLSLLIGIFHFILPKTFTSFLHINQSSQTSFKQKTNPVFSLKNLESENRKQTLKTKKPIDTKEATQTGEEKTKQPTAANKPSHSENNNLLSGDEQYLAFTFDDGPYALVDQKILDLFSQYDGHATFFVLGSRIPEYPEVITSITKQGSEIGNHSYAHRDFTKLSLDEVINQEILPTSNAVESLTGIPITLIRAPYGSVNQEILDAVDLAFVNWSIDSEDWKTRDAELIYQEIMKAQNGSVILLHSLYEETYEALEKALPELYQQGCRFVTVSELYTLTGQELSYHSINY